MDAEKVKSAVLPLLKNEKIFGVDLETVGLSDKVITFFVKELEGNGAVRKTLKEALGV